MRALAGIEEGKDCGARSDAKAPRSGSRSHVARPVIRHGTNAVVVLTTLVEAIAHEKAEEAKEGELWDPSRIRLGICAMAPAVGEQDHVASLARGGTPETFAFSVWQTSTGMVRGLSQ